MTLNFQLFKFILFLLLFCIGFHSREVVNV